MDIKPVTPDFAVADQVTVSDLEQLKQLGYQTLICNRPDGEAEGQPTADSLAAAAKAMGFGWAWIPISSGVFTDEAVAAFAAALNGHAKPALAFCRTGTRSVTLWALSQAGLQPAEALLSQASAAGYDLSAHARRLADRHQP
ncbi:TIGR01244 family sulfur transferase [Oceanimonas baumannii]|uniref:TIGR01244 family sulfur transferase n=1 Tax=Oceanimonas baumannii TaxID=129578 RepID=UPI003A9192E9